MNTLEVADYRARWAALITRKLAEAGMSAYRLAQILGVSRPAVSSWVNGHGAPTPANQSALVRVLNITPEELADLYRDGEGVA